MKPKKEKIEKWKEDIEEIIEEKEGSHEGYESKEEIPEVLR